MIEALIILILNLILNLIILLFLIFCLVPILRGAPYVPIHQERIRKAFELVEIGPGKKISDLGSGDGRILIAAAKKGAKAYGFEINPFLVMKARAWAKKEGVGDLVFCQWKSFWRQNYADYDVVFIYGITYIMKGLEKKLQRELKPGAKVVCFVFSFPNWQPIYKENGIFIYER